MTRARGNSSDIGHEDKAADSVVGLGRRDERRQRLFMNILKLSI